MDPPEEHLRNLSLSSGTGPDTSRGDDKDEADQMKDSMQQDALLRSRLLSTFHTESKARRSHLQLSGLGTPGSGMGDEDGGFQSPPPPAVAPLGDAALASTASGGVSQVGTDIGDGWATSISSLAAAAAAASAGEPPTAGAGAGAGGGNGGKARGRSISFSLSLPGISTSGEPAVAAAAAGGPGVTVPTPGSVAGPAERYTTLDLFPDYPEQFLPQVQDFQRVIILNTPEPPDSDTQTACKQLRKAMRLRSKWLGVPLEPEAQVGSGARAEQQGRPESPLMMPHAPSQVPMSPGSPRTQAYNRMKRRQAPPYDPFAYAPPAASKHQIQLVDGVYHVADEGGERVSEVFSVDEFFEDFHELSHLLTSGPVKTYSYKRLQVLEARFHLHKLLNSDRELTAQKSVPHRDFYNIRKVDTHVHHSACMHLKHLLRFIKHKLKTCGGEIVAFRDGQFLTLKEVFQSLKITAMDLSVDTLDMHANNTFHRFDRFNLKYNPAGQSRLREIFLKTDNLIAGRYLAEVTQQVMSDLDASKYQLVEWRVSIYGRKPSEWDKLARWFYTHRLASDKVRWLIQIPRLYAVYKASGEIEDFEHILRNIFAPLFEATRDPQSNVPLATFLETIVGFDCVDDESKPELHSNQGQRFPPPKEWKYKQDPPYSYWCYYLFANIKSLNDFRRERGMSTFEFRPHCGEAGDPEHLVAAYLVADKINHGIVLRKIPGLQLLYYLSRIGIAMSPLSNNKLFLDYHRNPFVKYFYQGLNVSLSTDDPLMLHYTKDPLVEEYSVAAQVWRLSSADLCEIARNSVLQSGFEHRFKRHFLGQHYELPGAAGNDIRQTNLPDIRVRYRYEIWRAELDQVLYHDDPGAGPARYQRRKTGGTFG